MVGLTNYAANAVLNWEIGISAMPALASRYLALFTAVGTDAGTGFTECTGTNYARQQVAGTVATSATTTTASAVLTFASVPAWLYNSTTPSQSPGLGMQVLDVTTSGAITGAQTVTAVTSTTVTLSANVNATVNSGDTIVFSAFAAPSGTAPSTTTNSGATIYMATAGGTGWGTAIAWGLYDASSSGNLITWDFLGNYAWLPFEIPTASSLATVKGNGYASNDPVVFTAEYGGTLPTLSTGTMTGYTVNYVATPATDTINVDTTSGPSTPIVTTSSGSGMVRKILQQAIANNTQPVFSTSTFSLSLA